MPSERSPHDISNRRLKQFEAAVPQKLTRLGRRARARARKRYAEQGRSGNKDRQQVVVEAKQRRKSALLNVLHEKQRLRDAKRQTKHHSGRVDATPIKQKRNSNKRRPANASGGSTSKYIDDEADVEDEGGFSSGDDGEDENGDLEGFIVDDEAEDEQDTSFHQRTLRAPEGASVGELAKIASRLPTHEERKAEALAVFDPQDNLPHWEDSFPPPTPEEHARLVKFGLIEDKEPSERLCTKPGPGA
ncbi:hypothetical protein V8E36_004365 [Tilletia maclaganii]